MTHRKYRFNRLVILNKITSSCIYEYFPCIFIKCLFHFIRKLLHLLEKLYPLFATCIVSFMEVIVKVCHLRLTFVILVARLTRKGTFKLTEFLRILTKGTLYFTFLKFSILFIGTLHYFKKNLFHKVFQNLCSPLGSI